MAADFTYDYFLAVDNNGVPVGGADFTLYAAASGGLPSPMYDMNGSPIGHITSNANGTCGRFRADIDQGYLDNGTLRLPIASTAVMNSRAQATAAQSSAAASATAAQQSATSAQQSASYAASLQTSGITGAPSTWPSTFPPSAHSHPASQISDASAVGRQVMTAADQQSARAAIGAGTGNGTSNLTLGTTSSTAAPGNHVHTASAVGFTPTGGITATDVQAAIVQAASTGGSSTGGGDVKNVYYVSGAYEALPAAPDPGWRLIVYHGPTPPSPPVSSAYGSILKDWQVRA